MRRSGTKSIVWSSIAGTVMCIVGIAWGLWRLAPLRGYRLRDHRHWSPYAGWMRWHHYAGLIFGIVTTTWIFSGLLSMDPWDWHPSTAPTRDQRIACRRRADRRSTDLTVDTLRSVRRGVRARSSEGDRDHRAFAATTTRSARAGIVSFDEPQFGARDQLPADLDRRRRRRRDGRRADRGHDLARSTTTPITTIAIGALSLPVLRVRYARSAADVALFRSEARRDRAQGRAADAAQSLAVSRLSQPRFSVPLLPAARSGTSW